MKKKIWFITGVSSGLGNALAQEVMKEGGFVIGTFRQQKQVDSFNLQNPGNGRGVLMDITDLNCMKSVVQSITLEYGRIDVLVNNAGIGFAGAVEETSFLEARKVMDTNFFSVLKMTQEVLPIMRKQRSGHILQISSHGGVKAFAGFGMYNASKFAVEGLSEALAQEVLPHGIKVTIVEPGPFRTSFADSNLKLANNIIYDYAETAGAFKIKLQSVNGKQEGDPKKAAEAMFEYVNQSNSPLRLPLGKVALGTIRAKIKSLTGDLEANQVIAENAIFD